MPELGVPGSPVAVGPADAEPEVVRDATAQLALLVSGGTEVAAAAGVDLGGGFTSARLAGAQGDRRDAVLAALKVGPSVTKRVGAATYAAVAEEQWAALSLASAASDLLGPEQLERVLGLRPPEGIDPFPHGAASTVADHLSRVLTGYPRPRRLALIVSLWDHVCALLVERQRAERRAAAQIRAERIEKLRERHREHFDELIMQRLATTVSGNLTLAAAARWRPPKEWIAREIRQLLHDAIAATALLRFAKTMSDEGLAAGTFPRQ